MMPINVQQCICFNPENHSVRVQQTQEDAIQEYAGRLGSFVVDSKTYLGQGELGGKNYNIWEVNFRNTIANYLKTVKLWIDPITNKIYNAEFPEDKSLIVPDYWIY